MMIPVMHPNGLAQIFDKRTSQYLRVGMMVRIPTAKELTRPDSQFRDFWLGRIEVVDNLSNEVLVQVKIISPSDGADIQSYACPCVFVQRCKILPDTRVDIIDRALEGTVIAVCTDDWTPGEFYEYYVQIEGHVERHSEQNLLVASHRADPDPRTQMLTYEFQQPSFHGPRNALVEAYTELRSATFGIEELVGSRIMLLAHQAEVVATVLSDEECRYILADEVGLGKTVEAAVILKGLRRRHPNLQTLIVVPAALVAQWYFELDHKFWLRFSTLETYKPNSQYTSELGLIVSHEQLASDPELSEWVVAQMWGLLIVDEAHHVPRNPSLNENVYRLSSAIPRVLLLSATPVQRRVTEFFALLRLLHPWRFRGITTERFTEMLGAQFDLQRLVARLVPDLSPKHFDPEYFCEEMEDVVDLLHQDAYVTSNVARVQANRSHTAKALKAAQEVVAYISENYRLERRVIRNRRANLQIDLPTRIVDESYAYTPTAVEAVALDELHEYADDLLKQHDHAQSAVEMVRLFFHAAFSSPQALLELIHLRQIALETNSPQFVGEEIKRLAIPTSPRSEPGRIRQLLASVPSFENELDLLKRLSWHTERWQDETINALDTLSPHRNVLSSCNRLVQVLCAIDEHVRKKHKAKIVVFATWLTSLQVLIPYLRKHIGKEAIFQFHVELPESDLQDQVIAFQETPRQAVLLCDELGGEGRNFQMADLIIHVDLPWAPAKIEQRIGRVDRLGRSGEVISVVAYARDQIEQDLFQIWQSAFDLFTRSMSGMEIALEGIQDELVTSLRQGTRDGLVRILPEMQQRAARVREQVEEERHYEERAIKPRRRDEFVRVNARYNDGSVLRGPLLEWATQAGLENSYHRDTDTAFYYPRNFNLASMHNAKFNEVPNMEHALARSHRASGMRIEGTFNRMVALIREDLVFFAPGSDPWTEAIIRNAVEADRGRCCVIRRDSRDVAKPSLIFDLTYRIQVDPRPLLELGHDPIHLLRAQGYLYKSVHHLLLNHKGERVATNDQLAKLIQAPFRKTTDIHLGQRSGDKPPLAWFKSKFPTERWHSILDEVFAAAQSALAEEFSFMQDVGAEAQEEFDQVANGLRASVDWYISQQLVQDAVHQRAAVDTYCEISGALVAGLRNPHFVLESVCCWLLVPANR